MARKVKAEGGFSGLVEGAKFVAIIVGFIGAAYLLAILLTLVVGVITKIGTDGSIPATNASSTAIAGLEGSFNTVITTALSPFTTIAALVILVVILVIFFRKGKVTVMGGGSKGGIN